MLKHGFATNYKAFVAEFSLQQKTNEIFFWKLNLIDKKVPPVNFLWFTGNKIF